MSEWESISLDQFVTFQRGFDLPISTFVDGNVPVFGSTSILGYHNEAKVKAPGVITGRSGTLGQFQYTEEDFFPHNTSLWVKDFKGNNPKFAYYLMQCLDFSGFNSGGAVPTLNRNVLKSFTVHVPPLPIQQKIAAILSAYDDLIENNLKQIKLLEEMAQITYEEWFVRFKFPNHENTPVDEKTGLPLGWERKKLGDLTSYINRGISPSYVENDGFPVINQKCVRNHFVNFEESRLTSNAKSISEDKQLKKFDILINSTGTGTLGRIAQLFESVNHATVDTHVTIVRAGDVSSLFLGRALEHAEGFIESLGKGATNQQELSRTDLAEIVELVVPSQDLQNKYDELAMPIYDTITFYRKQNQLLKEARDILLPRLMTGKIEV